MKIRFTVNLAVLFSVLLSCPLNSVCVAQPAMSPADKILLTKAQEAVATDNSQNIQRLEPNAIKFARSSAARNGDRLLLYLKSGEIKIYVNRSECKTESQESACQKFVLLGYIRSEHLFLIAKLYYESAEYILLDDRTGQESIMRAVPELSPSGRYAVLILQNDEQVGFGLQIWLREGTQFVPDWSGTPFVDGIYTSYKLVDWIDDGLLKFKVVNSFVPPKKDASCLFAGLVSAESQAGH